MPKQESFEYVWSLYINGPHEWSNILEQDALLQRCTDAAINIDQLALVLTAASSPRIIPRFRSPILKRMIDMATTKEEVQRVYALASSRDKRGSYALPARQREAQKKLVSLET